MSNKNTNITGIVLLAFILLAGNYMKEKSLGSISPSCNQLKKDKVCADTLTCEQCIQQIKATQNALGPGQ